MADSIKLKDKVRFFWRALRYRWILDPSEIAILRQILKPGDVAVDVGAHKGAYAYWMSKSVGPKGHIYGFEPQKHLAERLWVMLKALKLDNIKVFHMGLSSKSGLMKLFVPGSKKTSPEATFEQPERYESGNFQEVKISTLVKALAEETRPIRLIKCDVEGHELEVFKGSETVLKQHHPCLLFECEARHHADGDMKSVFDYLKSLGYEGFFFLGRKCLPLSQFRAEYQIKDVKPYANNFLFKPV